MVVLDNVSFILEMMREKNIRIYVIKNAHR